MFSRGFLRKTIIVSFANIPVIDNLFSGIHQLDLNGTWQELEHPGPAVVDQGFHHDQRVYPQLAGRKFDLIFRLLKLKVISKVIYSMFGTLNSPERSKELKLRFIMYTCLCTAKKNILIKNKNLST